jgi:hypothetical protein
MTILSLILAAAAFAAPNEERLPFPFYYREHCPPSDPLCIELTASDTEPKTHAPSPKGKPPAPADPAALAAKDMAALKKRTEERYTAAVAVTAVAKPDSNVPTKKPGLAKSPSLAGFGPDSSGVDQKQDSSGNWEYRFDGDGLSGSRMICPVIRELAPIKTPLACFDEYMDVYKNPDKAQADVRTSYEAFIRCRDHCVTEPDARFLADCVNWKAFMAERSANMDPSEDVLEALDLSKPSPLLKDCPREILDAGIMKGFYTESHTDPATGDCTARKPPENVVLNPFKNAERTNNPGNGLRAELYYAGRNLYSLNPDRYLELGTKYDGTLFLDSLSAYPQAFNSGFLTSSDGKPLADTNGQPILEWFGMKIEGKLTLRPEDEEGFYQFAIIVDDGAIFQDLSEPGMDTTIVDTRDGGMLHCSLFSLKMTRDKKLPIRVKYFQGPRYEVALVLLWRKVEPGQLVDRTFCGPTGHAVPRREKDPGFYEKLESLGWHVLSPANFLLP